MAFLYHILIGILIGTGAILPGISSGVLCVIFGIYDKLIDSILGFFKNIKENFKFLFPICMGVGFGVILFGNILKTLFLLYDVQIKFAFIGLILGGLPSLIRIANSKKGFRLHYLLYTIISFTISIFLILLEKNINTHHLINSQNILFLIFSGFIMSAGVVIPGISSTVLLMLLGTYEIYLDAVSSINISILFPMGIGLVLGGLAFLKLIQYAFEHYFSQTYYIIIGFVLGSLSILYPRL